MQYRLLRNNKESGPYTKAQLEEMGLKPYDLLWIEGRGGAWQYASEIPDLKSIAPIVEEQPYDRFYKGKEKQTAALGSKENNSAYTSDIATATGKTATKSPKPRIRITGDKVVMIDNTALQQPQPIDNIISAIPKEQPAAKAVQPPVKQEPIKEVQTAGPDWEEVYTDWKGDDIKQEEAAAPAAAKTQNFEEIKQRYEESKLKQLDEKQHKTANTVKQNIMAAIAVLALAIGGYAGYKLNNSTAGNRATQTAPVEKAEVVQDENNQPQSSTDSVAGTAATPSSQTSLTNSNEAKQNEIKNSLSQADNVNTNPKPLPQADNSKASTANLPSAATSSKTILPVQKKETTAVNNKPANTVAKTGNQPITKSPVAANTKVANPSLNKTSENKKQTDLFTDVQKAITTAAVQTQPVTAPPAVKKEASKKKISDYVTVNKLGSASNTGSVQNVLLSVKNVTDFPIDLAVIDIQYYGSNGRYQKGETMYVRNISAGDNVNVRIPDSKTSNSISYKVSLVSSEQKTLYLVGD